LPTQFEVVAAEKLKQLVPWVDRVKWVKTGSNACTTALKIARRATGRELVLSEGYHGEAEEFCRYYNRELPNNVQALKPDLSNLSSSVGAVIIEPIVTDWSERRQTWLRTLQTECAKRGILTIWDEVITGLRWPKFTVAAWLNLRPDLMVMGKAMANGLPIACVAGSKELMDRPDYFASTTYGGEVLSLAAADAVMTLLLSKKCDIDRLWQYGAEFISGFNAVSRGVVELDAYPTRGVFKGSDTQIALFLQETVKAGLLFGKSWCVNFDHMQPAIQDATFAALEGVFQRIRDGRAVLEGPLPESPLAAKARAS
jgi:glutamate-1-semialdehyde aminotransferase